MDQFSFYANSLAQPDPYLQNWQNTKQWMETRINEMVSQSHVQISKSLYNLDV